MKSISKSVRRVIQAYTGEPNNIIEVECNDTEGELVRLLSYVQRTGNIGHSFDIVVDPDNKEFKMSFGWDGDGADRIRNIKLDGKKVDFKDYFEKDKSETDKYNKKAQFFEMDPQMLLRLLQDYLKSTEDDWNYVLPTDLYGLIEKNMNPYFLIDVRKPEDYQRGHIPGAINIFWLDMLREDNIRKLPADKEILVYCYVGHTSSQVMVLLSLLGFRVKSLKFGMGISPSEDVEIKGWKDYKFPVKKGNQP